MFLLTKIHGFYRKEADSKFKYFYEGFTKARLAIWLGKDNICRNIYRQRKQIYNYQWGEGRVEGQIESMRLADTNYYV